MGPTGNPLPDERHPVHEPPLPPSSALFEDDDSGLRGRLSRIAAFSPVGARYEVKDEIGRGGMSRVLRVWDEVLQRELAMKVVSLEPRGGASEEQNTTHRRQLFRFVEEARITGRLDHPGIVPVHEIALDEEGHLYFTMPLVRGQDLGRVFDHVRAGEQNWNLHRAISVLHKVCLTVAFAHSRGVVHRDLKPQNILVGPFGEAYVVDWGLALVVGKRERRAMIGTPAYMSPEQAAGIHEQVGPRSDVYSLGAILYELLSERIPHQLSMEQEAGTMARVLGRPPRPVGELAGDAPSELVAVCDKAMAADPDERYPTVLQMAEDLQAWMEGRVVRAYESGHWARARKWGKRNRVLLQSLLVVLALSAGVVVLQQQSTIRQVNAKRREALRSGYAANINAADLGLRMHETNEAKRRLLDCDEGLRGWEWRHLMLRSDTSAATLRAHKGEVRDVATSPDGSWIASASDDGTIRLWSSASGRVERVLAGHTDVVTAVAFHPDGTRLASGSQDRSVRLWDLATGGVLDVLDGHASRVVALAYRDDGVLASGDLEGRIAVWDPGGHEPVALETPREPVHSLAFDPRTGRLASGHAVGVVRLWDLETATTVASKTIGPDRVLCLDYDPEGTRLAAGVSRYLFLLDATDLSLRMSLEGHAALVTSLAFSPTGDELVSGSFDNTVRLWSTAGHSLGSFVGHDDDVNCVAFLSPERFVSGSEDDTVRLWSTAARSSLTLAGHGGWVTSLAFREDGEQLISGSRDGRLIIWSVESGSPQTIIPVESGVECVAYGSGDRIAFGCGDANLRLGPAHADASWTELQGSGAFPRTVLFQGERLVARDWQSVRIWKASSGESLLVVDVPDDAAGSLAVDPGGTLLAIGSESGEVRLRDLTTGEVTATLRCEAAVTALAFSSDGALLACGTVNRSIALWSVPDAQWTGSLDGHESRITALAFAPDDARLASGSLDNTVRIWNPHTLEALLALRGHDQAVTAVSFSPDGDQIASASKDGTVRIWRTTPPLETP